MVRSVVLCALAALLLPSHDVRAQLVIRVEAHAIGVPQVEVAVWGPQGRLAGAYTDAAGIARLRFDRSRAANGFVTARRIGYAPVRVAIPGSDSLHLVLEQVPTSLPAVSVHNQTLKCPAAPEDSAVALLASASARYQDSQDNPVYLGYVDAFDDEFVSGDERGYGEELRKRRNGVTQPKSTLLEWLIPPPPYALWERHMDGGGEYWAWRYSPLETFSAWHFADSTFRVQHTFVVLGQSDGSSTLGFCSRDQKKPGIEGELVIGPDSLLRSARWQFLVPHDANDAGGEATFDVGRLDGNLFLVPIRGSFWRSTGHGRYDQQRYERLGWRLGHTPTEAAAGWDAIGDQTTPDAQRR